jgi:hypothetical protein
MKSHVRLNIPGRWVILYNTGDIGVCHDFTIKFKKPAIDPRGRKYVCLRGKNYYIHRLVAENFVPNPRKYRYILFKNNNNPANTNYKNLIWSNKRYTPAFKKGRLTAANIKKIRTHISRGDPLRVIADAFDVHPSLISHIKAGRRYRNV